MSTWSTEDFDRTVSQSFTIPRITFLNKLTFKAIKIGLLSSSAVFTVQIKDGDSVMLSETFTGADLNAAFSGDGSRFDINIDCADIVLTPSLDGTPHTYTLEWSASAYVSTATSRLMLARREFGDDVLPISNLPIGFPNNEIASAYPIFIEFFSYKG